MQPDSYLPPASRVFVAGAETLLGSALLERLRGTDAVVVVAPPEEPDLTDPVAVDRLFARTKPDYVVVAAGKSGGIRANQAYPVTLMHNNLLVTTHILHAARVHDVRRLLYLGSSCTYPRPAGQPLRVESLWSGPPEPTSAAYAAAKLAGMTLCRAYRQQYGVDFIAAIPANSYGPGDDFSPADSHVIPGLMSRLHNAQERGVVAVSVWGTGLARREFVYSADLAEACLFVLAHCDDGGPINLGGCPDASVAEVAREIADVVGYRGRLVFDPNQPDGMPFKGLDCGPLRALGWTPRTPLRQGLALTYEWFLRHVPEGAHHVRAAV